MAAGRSEGGRDKVRAAAARAVVEAFEPRVLWSAAPAGMHGRIASGLAFTPRLSDLQVNSTPYLPPQRSVVNYGDGLLSAPARGRPLDIALGYLTQHAADFGATAADFANPVVTDQYADPDTGETHIYLRQRVNGLEVANANLSISLTRDNRVITAGGGFVPTTVVGGGTAAAASQPRRSATQAVQDFAARVGLTAATAPRVVSAARTGRRHTVLSAKAWSLDNIPADLHYVASAGGLQLAWNVVLRTPDRRHWYNASVDASTGRVVATNDWVDNALYDVYALPTKSPQDGPRTIVTDPQDLAFSPYGWHDTNGIPGAEFTDTRGNNVSAQEDANADNAGGSRPDGGAGLNFDFPLEQALSPAANQAAAVTNLFYWTNLLHDVHAEYGFTEASGNFQVKNYTGQGKGNDAVQADAQDGSGTDNANFATPPDGQAPRMQMYLFTATNPGRDGDLDSQIMVHEYGHGVSNRLTGGPANADALSATQSGGMGEGWSDWWGLMFTQKSSDTQNAAYPIGTYVKGQSDAGTGIRRYPYSYDLSTDPLTFEAYNADAAHEVHRTGEIWSSTLWDLNWLLINKYGYSPTIAGGYNPAAPGKNGGNNLALKLVMDALKLQPANPSFTQARDALLAADQALNGGADQLQIWTAFARRGLGYSAATDSAEDASVTTAFDIPPTLLSPKVAASAPAGSQTAAVDHVDFTFDKAMDPASFAVADDVPSFTGPGGLDLRSQITGSSWLGGNKVLRVTFAPQSADGQYALTIGPQILAAADAKPMDQDGDGTPGEGVQDSYTARFGYDADVMRVVGTSPADGALAALPFTTLDVTLSEPYDPASVGTDDLTTSQGTVTAATPVNATTIRYTLSGVTAEGTLAVHFAAGALIDAGGNTMAAYDGSYVLDAATIPFPTLVAETPLGSLVYDGTSSASVGAPGDTDAFTLNLEAGQTLTVAVRPAAGLRPTVQLTGPGGEIVAAATADDSGIPALLQTIPLAAGGTYTVTIAGAGGTIGAYTLGLTLNAAVEAEHYGQPPNDTQDAAQNLDPAFTSLGGSAARAAVTGNSVSAVAPTTVYSADFEDGDDGFTVSNGTNGLWHQSVGRGSQAGHSPTHSFYFGKNEGPTGGGTYATGGRTAGTLTSPAIRLPFADYLALDFNYILQTENVPAWDLAQVQISNDGGDTYTTLATYNGSAESSSWKTAAPVDLTAYIGQKVNLRWSFDTRDGTFNGYEGWYVDDVRVRTLPAATDYYSLTLAAGQGLSAAVKSQVGNLTVRVYDPAGNLVATGAKGLTNVDSAVASYVAPAAGTYAVRVGGPAGSDYRLVATRGAAFDLEPNNTFPAARNIEPLGGVAVGSTDGTDDLYAFTAVAGSTVTLSTATPGDGPGQFANPLNPRVDLYNASGGLLAGNDDGAADGRNARLTYVVPTTGTYYARVAPSVRGQGDGEYILTVAGAAPLSIPSVPDLVAASDTGVSATDNLTNRNNATPDKTLQFSVGGTLPGATVTLYAGGVAVGSAVATGTTTVVTTDGATALADRAYVVTARQALPGRSASPDSAGLLVTIDATAPAKPAAPDLRSVSDTGVSDSDNLTNAASPSFAVAPNPYFRVYLNGQQAPGDYGSASVVTTGPLADGIYAVTGAAVDAAGNVSTASDPLAVTIDTTPPAAALAASNVTAAGGTSYLFTVTFTDGVGVDVATLDNADALVTGPNGFSQTAAFVSVDVTTNGTPRTATYRITPPGGTWGADDNGTYAVTLQPSAVRDTAGNSAATSILGTFAVTAPPPPAPGGLDLTAATDSGASQTDDLTNFNNRTGKALEFTVAGTAAGATVTIYADGVPVGSATGTAPSTVVRTNGLVSLADGVRVFTARQRVAGGPESVDSPALAVTIDVAPPIPFLTAPNVTAAGGTDYQFTVTFTDGIGVDAAGLANATVQVSGPGGFAQTVSPISVDPPGSGTPRTTTYRINAPGGTWGLNNVGKYTITLISPVQDSAGNATATPNPLGNFYVAVPLPPLSLPLDLADASDTGPSKFDDITYLNNHNFISALHFMATGAAQGAIITLYADGIQVGSATASGTISAIISDATTVLADGVHLFTVRQGFFGGPVSADSPPLAVTISTTPPATPPPPDLRASSDSGVSDSDNITNVASPTLDLPGREYYRLYRDDQPASAGQYAIGPYTSPTLADGTYSFRANAINVAGVPTALSQPLILMIDTKAPTVAITPIAPGPRTTPVVTMAARFSEAAAGFDLADLTLTRDGGPNLLSPAQTLTTTDNLNWSLGNLAPLTLTPGTYTLAVKAAGTGVTDVAGNALAGGSSQSFVISPSAPVAVPAGGFETPAVGTGPTAYQYAPATGGWVFSVAGGHSGSGVAGNGSDLTRGNPPAPEGAQVAFLGGEGSFAQAVPGWHAGAYVVTFSAAQWAGGPYGLTAEDFRVLVDGAVVGVFKPFGSGYTAYATAAFAVPEGTHTVTFQGLNSAGGDNVALIDDVRIVGAPPLPVGVVASPDAQFTYAAGTLRLTRGTLTLADNFSYDTIDLIAEGPDSHVVFGGV